jgi:hypothetical protein
MPSGTATVSATTGPGKTVTSKVITGIKTFRVDIDRQMLFVNTQNSDADGPNMEFALTNTVTFTVSVSAGNYTLTITAT